MYYFVQLIQIVLLYNKGKIVSQDFDWMICKQDGGHKSYMTCLVFIAKILIKLHWPLSYSVFTLSWNMSRPIMNKACFTMKTIHIDQAAHFSNQLGMIETTLYLKR